MGTPRGRRRERGAALVEAAMSSIAFFFLVFGIIDFGRALYAYHAVAYGAEAGTRYALVNGRNSATQTNATEVQDYVKDLLEASNLNRNSITVTPTWQNGQMEQGTWVRVQVNYQFNFIFLLSSITMSSHSQVVIQR
jgi:Flp pilus assembly protein TadG